jgi:hypothetical protein
MRNMQNCKTYIRNDPPLLQKYFELRMDLEHHRPIIYITTPYRKVQSIAFDYKRLLDEIERLTAKEDI